MFEENLNKTEKKETRAMQNTQEFRQALEQGNLDQAEAFLDQVAGDPEEFPQYDDRWLDHRQRELFQAYYAQEDWAGAKRIVETTKSSTSKAGRIARLEELSGLDYNEI